MSFQRIVRPSGILVGQVSIWVLGRPGLNMGAAIAAVRGRSGSVARVIRLGGCAPFPSLMVIDNALRVVRTEARLAAAEPQPAPNWAHCGVPVAAREARGRSSHGSNFRWDPER
jgi:hypothetical protein